jgi:hypothetical protein
VAASMIIPDYAQAAVLFAKSRLIITAVSGDSIRHNTQLCLIAAM